MGWRTQHLKQRTAHAFKEVNFLRAELERAEAAVVGGKKKRDSDVAERETQLRHCQEEIRRLEAEVRFGQTILNSWGRQRMTKYLQIDRAESKRCYIVRDRTYLKPGGLPFVGVPVVYSAYTCS